MRIDEILEGEIIPFRARQTQAYWDVIAWNGQAVARGLDLQQAEQAARIQSSLMRRPVLITDGERTRRTVEIDGRWSLGEWESA
jgi:hypothetical protein